MKRSNDKAAPDTELNEKGVMSNMRRLDVLDIMRGESAVCLEFEGKQYILRITSNRKLILTK